MRLIDVDVLIKEVNENKELFEKERVYLEGLLLNAPTVEPYCYFCGQKEHGIRPQGEWIGNAFDEHHCNRCGHPALWEEEPDGYYEVQSRFCPNCGAKMKER